MSKLRTAAFFGLLAFYYIFAPDIANFITTEPEIQTIADQSKNKGIVLVVKKSKRQMKINDFRAS